MKPSLLNHPAISGRYFFPQDWAVENPFLVNVDGATLACYLKTTDASEGFTLVHFHGNGETVSDYVPEMANAFSSLGLNVLFVEYRGYGGSTGRPEVVTMLGDGVTALQQAGIAPEKAIVFGRSVGSLYAIELAYRVPAIAGLIIESGIADPYERFLKYADFPALGHSADEVKMEALKYFDHKQKLGAYHNPVLILHTEFDRIIDINHAERNYSWTPSPDKQLVRFPNGDHNSIFPENEAHYIEHLKRFCNSIKHRGDNEFT